MRDDGCATHHQKPSRAPLRWQRIRLGSRSGRGSGWKRSRWALRGYGSTWRLTLRSACAAAVASMKLGLIDARTDVHLPGGTLTIEWQPGSSVFLTGPAKNVFTGEVDIDFSASSH